MPTLTELQPAPRCTFVGKDIETESVLRCARWMNHELDTLGHLGYLDVVRRMAGAIISTQYRDLKDAGLASRLIALKQARLWWKRLMLDGVITEQDIEDDTMWHYPDADQYIPDDVE